MTEAIYTLTSFERMQELLDVFGACMGLPAQLLNGHGAVLQQHGEPPACCALLRRQVFTAGECARTHLAAGRRAMELGESYIFACAAQLNHIAFPLVSRHSLLGTVLIGPFLMDTPDSTLISDLAERASLSPQVCLAFYDALHAAPVITPPKVNQIAKLVQHLFTPLITDEKLLMHEKQEKLYQQSRINETIQMYKGEAQKPSGYPYEKERALLVKVKTCDIQSAKALLNDMLGHVLFVEGRDTEVIKSRALELTTLLSRVAIEGGAPADHIYSLNHQFLSRLRHLDDFEALCLQLQDIVEAFIHSISLPVTDAGSAPIREAVRYIAVHYEEPLTLAGMAQVAGVSPTYFSSLFTKTMGINYQEYLARVRIEEAKHLLSATSYPLSQIAVSVGYSDQSSFSKAFKRLTGLTPNQYR